MKHIKKYKILIETGNNKIKTINTNSFNRVKRAVNEKYCLIFIWDKKEQSYINCTSNFFEKGKKKNA